MKVNDKDLINRYKAYIKSKSPLSKINCPSREDMVKAFNPKTGEKQKTKIIDHISECHKCTEEFEILRQIFRASREMDGEMDKILSTAEDVDEVIEKANQMVSKTKKPQKLSSVPLLLLSPKYLTWAAAIVVLVIGSILIFKLPGLLSDRHEERGLEKIKIEIFEPEEGKNIVKPVKKKFAETLIFRWEKYPETEYYILKLYNETLILLYESKKIVDNKLILPPEVLEELPGNKTYFWMVTAFSGNEKKVESDLQNLKLVSQ